MISENATRQVDIPADFAAALTASPVAKAKFDKMPPSHKSRHIWAINEAKKPETRARRIEQAIQAMSR